jgi:hypothetical protein
MASSIQPQQPRSPDGPGPGPNGGRAHTDRPPAAVLAFVAVVLGTAVLGLIAGLVWAAVAPRALLVVVGHGQADVVDPETSAFIAADGWFVLLSVIGGAVSGLLGYLLAVRRHGALAMAGVLAGALAAALIARWAGEQPGAAAFSHLLAVSKPGVHLRPPISLGGVGALAFWPLSAGLTAGAFEAVQYFRERHRVLDRQSAYPAPPRPGLGAWTPPRAPTAPSRPDGDGGAAGSPASSLRPPEAASSSGQRDSRGQFDGRESLGQFDGRESLGQFDGRESLGQRGPAELPDS